MGRMVACVEDSSTGMERKPLCLPNHGISSHKRVKRARITLLPVHRRQTPRRTLGLSSKAILRLGRWERRLFVAATILNQLGYFLHLGKCVPVPTQRLIFLGHLVDTTRQTFSISKTKRKRSLGFVRACCQINLSLLTSSSAFRKIAYP